LVSRFWWVAPLALVVGIAGWWRLRERPAPRQFSGYIASAATLDSEYSHFQGKELRSEAVRLKFRQAGELSAAGAYTEAVALLEAVSRDAPVPVVFNDLGVLYAQLKDRARTVNAFREALAADPTYPPARSNLERLKAFLANSAEPVTREIEPNNTNLLANLIALGRPVEGEIAAGQDDVDCFRFIAPPGPRDILTVEIANRSKTLAPMVTFYDGEMGLMDWRKDVSEPGAPLELQFSPEPGATYYLQVRGHANSGGLYTVTVRALKAFDANEPDDDIRNPHRIEVGQTIDANIMDARDTDYYSFRSTRTGTVSVEIQNRSKTLVPALTTFTPDMRFSAFGPDVRTPGAGLAYQMPVAAGQLYYVEVWSPSGSAGEYSLSVQ
jgi:hypothetical protein